MVAEEMFEKLGYSKYTTEYEITYAKWFNTEDEESITFAPSAMNTPLIIVKKPSDNYDSQTEFIFGYKLIQAIQQQMKEMKW